MRTIWMHRLAQMEPDGDVICFTLESDGEDVLVRCKSHVALAAINFCERRWCEIDAERRKAGITQIGKR